MCDMPTDIPRTKRLKSATDQLSGLFRCAARRDLFISIEQECIGDYEITIRINRYGDPSYNIDISSHDLERAISAAFSQILVISLSQKDKKGKRDEMEQ